MRNYGGKTEIANKLNLSKDASFLSYAAASPPSRTIAKSGFVGPVRTLVLPQPLAVTGPRRQNHAARSPADNDRWRRSHIRPCVSCLLFTRWRYQMLAAARCTGSTSFTAVFAAAGAKTTLTKPP
jgi:hypothetical protein